MLRLDDSCCRPHVHKPAASLVDLIFSLFHGNSHFESYESDTICSSSGVSRLIVTFFLLDRYS